jgi:hypothetical protein
MCAAVFLGSQWAFWHADLHGDEPHVMMATIALLQGRFNVYPGYLGRDFMAIGFEKLQWQVNPINGFIPPEHGFSFAVFVLPSYLIAGVKGARFFLGAVSAMTFPLLYDNCRRSGLSAVAAATACLALACAAPWEFHATLIFPEVTAGVITMLILNSYLRFKATGHQGFSFAVGALTVLLPMLYLKYAAIAVASGVLLITDRSLRSRWATYGAAPLAIAYVPLWLYVYGPSIGIGTGAGWHDFQFMAFFDRFWYAFLDRDHGLWVWAPITATAVVGLFLWNQKTPQAQAYLIGVTSLYASLYAVARLSPGASEPGRYLVAACPAMIVLAALALLRPGRRPFGAAVFVALMLVSLTILAASTWYGHPVLPGTYAALFPRLYSP